MAPAGCNKLLWQFQKLLHRRYTGNLGMNKPHISAVYSCYKHFSTILSRSLDASGIFLAFGMVWSPFPSMRRLHRQE